jgi:hypothetical protein
MPHLHGAQYSKTGVGPVERTYFRLMNSGSLKFESVGSGVDEATVMTGGGNVRGLDLGGVFNTPAFCLRDNAATLISFASGAVGGQRFQPTWLPFSNTLTICKASGTAEAAWGVLTATCESIDDANVAL